MLGRKAMMKDRRLGAQPLAESVHKRPMLFSRGQKEPAAGDGQDKSLRVWISPSLKTRRVACAVITFCR